MLDYSAAIESLLGSVDDLRLPLGADEVAAPDQLPAQIVFTFLQRFDLRSRIREQIGRVSILAGIHEAPPRGIFASSAAHMRHGISTSGSALFRRRNKRSYSP